MAQSFTSSSTAARRSRFIAFGALTAVVTMLCLSFAAVPLYRMFCAKTGFAGTPQVAKAAPTIRGERTLVVRFDTNVAQGLAWTFVPDISQVSLRTGQTATVFFKVTNRTDHVLAAQATYNVTPDAAGGYFDKISCFCFSKQQLGPHETADMPVVFFLDPALEKDKTMAGVDTLTLSYTFYPAALEAVARQGQGKPVSSGL
jgi:cytochrome c oxidase assembly protein subunit 11